MLFHTQCGSLHCDNNDRVTLLAHAPLQNYIASAAEQSHFRLVIHAVFPTHHLAQRFSSAVYIPL